MKKITLIFITATLGLLFNNSCKKDTTTNTAKSPVGKWQWMYTYFDYTLSDSNPLTPKYSGIQQQIIFNDNNTFYRLKNNVAIDSGTYTYGHGGFTNLSNTKYEYDSILYYHMGVPIVNEIDYYKISSDTLCFAGALAGLYGGASIWWIKQ